MSNMIPCIPCTSVAWYARKLQSDCLGRCWCLLGKSAERSQNDSKQCTEETTFVTTQSLRSNSVRAEATSLTNILAPYSEHSCNSLIAYASTNSAIGRYLGPHVKPGHANPHPEVLDPGWVLHPFVIPTMSFLDLFLGTQSPLPGGSSGK